MRVTQDKQGPWDSSFFLVERKFNLTKIYKDAFLKIIDFQK